MPRCILLIVIDCLRADHVSCYGYPRPTTPTLDALAARSIRFEQVSAVSSWTKPSVASMLTGLYPTRHGAFRGIKRRKGESAVKTDVLRSSDPTLAEQFTQAGWRCGAFINNAQLGEFTGLNRGFTTYAPAAGKADRLIGIFLEWLEAELKKPAFAYLHFLEAHWPYKPRRRHVALFGGNRDTNPFRDFSARDYGKLRRAVSHQETTLAEDHLEQMIQMYDGAVRRLDGKIKIILAMLTELGLREETAVIVTADHGEEFLDHGRIGHGQSLYEELTHVPLIVHGPRMHEGPCRTDPVSLVDLPKTLLEMAGLDGRFPGRNLLESGATGPHVYGELSTGRRYTQFVRSRRWKLHREYRFDPSDDPASTTPWQQVCRVPHRIKLELYDVESDPREQSDLSEDPRFAQIRTDLISDLDRWWQEVADVPEGAEPSEVQIDPQVVQRLRDLGYLE